MKKVLFVCAMMLTNLSFANNSNPAVAEANGDDQSINKAIGAIKSSCPNAEGNLSYTVNVVSACTVDGFIKEVTFYKTSPCPPNQICIQVIETVGTVTLDCNNNVIGVTCGDAVGI